MVSYMQFKTEGSTLCMQKEVSVFDSWDSASGPLSLKRKGLIQTDIPVSAVKLNLPNYPRSRCTCLELIDSYTPDYKCQSCNHLLIMKKWKFMSTERKMFFETTNTQNFQGSIILPVVISLCTPQVIKYAHNQHEKSRHRETSNSHVPPPLKQRPLGEDTTIFPQNSLCNCHS